MLLIYFPILAQVTALENLIDIKNEVLDWKFNKYHFLIISTEVNETPYVYYNESLLVDLNRLKVLTRISPLLNDY